MDLSVIAAGIAVLSGIGAGIGIGIATAIYGLIVAIMLIVIK